jgi:hypothetical protein
MDAGCVFPRNSNFCFGRGEDFEIFGDGANNRGRVAKNLKFYPFFWRGLLPLFLFPKELFLSFTFLRKGKLSSPFFSSEKNLFAVGAPRI